MQNVYDYLFLCTRVKSLERSLLNSERMERMLEARSTDDALMVLSECGYGELSDTSEEVVNEALAAQRQKTIQELTALIPDPELINTFKVRYDYHNVKALLKAEVMNTDPTGLLLDTGRIPVKDLEGRVRSNELNNLPAILRTAIEEAREVLGTTQDPQLADFVLDRAYYKDMAYLAESTGSTFLDGYVRISVDAANLRTAVRTIRMGKNAEFLRDILFPGGNIDVTRVLSAASVGGSLAELFALSPLKTAAEVGMEALSGGRLTQFEKLCDDAVTEYLRSAKVVPVGEAPIIAYLAAKENEFTAIRIILTGRLANLPAETIRERLRDSYV